MSSEKIENIRKKFKHEWLLIAVDDVDPSTNEPVMGHLIAHGTSRGAIHEMSKNFTDLAYVIHSDDWPDDLAACFQAK